MSASGKSSNRLHEYNRGLAGTLSSGPAAGAGNAERKRREEERKRKAKKGTWDR
jgi:hypothetical protein